MDFGNFKIPDFKQEINQVATDLLGRLTPTQPLDQGGSDFESQLRRISGNGQSIKTSLMHRGLYWEDFNVGTPWSNWDKNFPYRLVVYRVDSTGYNEVASFRLPINPQDITITAPFAINTTITSRGVLEEHNGIPVKNIVINGTTGMLINRPSQDTKREPPGVLGTVFAGTIQTAQTALNQIQKSITAVRNLTGNNNPNNKTGLSDDILKMSGYYQYHLMRMFLETYAEIKKTAEGRSLRLAFDMQKDKQTYLITPGQLVTKRSSASLDYNYSLPMLAWGTVPRSQVAQQDSKVLDIIQNDIGTTRKLFNTLKQFRRTAGALKNIVSAARADVESNIYGPVNDTILLTKDILSIPRTVADFPKSLRDSYMTSVVANWESLSRTNEDLKRLFDTKMQDIISSGTGSNSYAGSKPASSLSYKADSFDNLSLTDSIDLDSLQLNDAQQQAADDATEKAKQITQNDLENLIKELQQLSDSVEAQIVQRNALDIEWDLLYDTQEAIASITASLADGSFRTSLAQDEEGENNQARALTAMDFWQQNADAANIPFSTYSGKFAIPFPYRATIEELANQYLGDATRWPDIVALNGLQYPYVDEDGFYKNFTANGNGSQLNVADATNLYVGQIVYIQSDTQRSSKRKITKISEISSTNFLIEVDGEANLSSYTAADNAKLKAFLPFTVNSMKQIYIPTNTTPDFDDVETKPITFIKEDENFVKFTKVDWLLDSKYDLAITNDGFMNLAFGNANLIQAAKLKLKTNIDSLLLHKGYGAGIEVGTSVADIDIDRLYQNISNSFQQDSRYNKPSYLSIKIDGGAMVMDIVASIRQGNGILPITLPLSAGIDK